MEEILASIRRIIADDEGKPAAAPKAAEPKAVEPKPAPKPAAAEAPKAAAPKPAPKQDIKPEPKPAPKPVAEPPAEMAATNSQDEIDAMLAGLDADTSEEEVRGAEDDVFDLTEAMAVEEPAAEAEAPGFQTIAPDIDIEFAEAVQAEAARPAELAAVRVPEPVVERQELARAMSETVAEAMPLASAATLASVNSAFNSLAHTVLSQNARTLEDLVREMLRPMLRAWLDDNLPGLVERLVKAEIERVSRGR